MAFTPGFPYGLQRLLGGLVFAVGLIMVVVGGSELFTGNCLIPMARAGNKVTTGEDAKDLDPTFFKSVAAGLKDGGSIPTWGNLPWRDLLPATIGNSIGGALFAGGMYWFIHLRPSWSERGAAGGVPEREAAVQTVPTAR